MPVWREAADAGPPPGPARPACWAATPQMSPIALDPKARARQASHPRRHVAMPTPQCSIGHLQVSVVASLAEFQPRSATCGEASDCRSLPGGAASQACSLAWFGQDLGPTMSCSEANPWPNQIGRILEWLRGCLRCAYPANSEGIGVKHVCGGFNSERHEYNWWSL